MSLVSAVKRARQEANLTLTEVARRSGLQVSNLSAIEAGTREPRVETVEKALRATGKKFVAVPAISGSAAETAEEIFVDIQRGFTRDIIRHVIQFSDTLDAWSAPEIRFALVIEAPDSTGSWEWDAVIAGLVEYKFQKWGWPVPSWVNSTVLSEPRTLDELTWPGDQTTLAGLDRTQWITHEAFTRRGVFFALDDLGSI